MFIRDLQKHLLELKRKDEIAIKKVDRRMHSEEYNYEFYSRVYSIYKKFEKRIPTICYALKTYIDNPLGEFFLGTPFDETIVTDTLKDLDFVALLVCNHLMHRTLKLNINSEGQVKLRVYIAILNYSRYKKLKPHL